MPAATPKTPSDQPRTNSDLEADIAQLRADLDKLVKQLAATGEHSYRTARRAAAQGADQIRAQGEAAMESIRSSADDIEDRLTSAVREKPVSSLAIAAAVGYFFALLSRR